MAAPNRQRPVAVRRRGSDAAEQRRAVRTAGQPAPDESAPGKVAPVKAGRRAITAFKIEPVKSVLHRHVNMLVYGPYGHGKTTFGGSAVDVPTMRDVLFINAESGDMSLTDRRDLDVITVKSYKQVARIVEYLFLHVRLRDEATPEAYAELLEMEIELKSYLMPLDDQVPDADGNTDPERTWFVEQRLRTGKPMDEPYLYRTVVIDSISEIYRLLIYKFTGVDIEVTKLDADLEKMEEWPAAQDSFRLFVRQFRSLEANVIFVAAESIEPPEKNKKRNPRAGQAAPKLAGQMSTEVAGFIDVVGYLVREQEEDAATGKMVFKRYMYLGAGYEGWTSKHRFENLPDLEYLANPSLTTLLELARKDQEHGTSLSNGEGQGRSTVTPSRHTARSAAPNRSSTASNAPRGSRRAGRGDHSVRRGS